MIIACIPAGSGIADTFPSAPAVVLQTTIDPGPTRNAIAWNSTELNVTLHNLRESAPVGVLAFLVLNRSKPGFELPDATAVTATDS